MDAVKELLSNREKDEALLNYIKLPSMHQIVSFCHRMLSAFSSRY